jgi:hypothetical protein
VMERYRYIPIIPYLTTMPAFDTRLEGEKKQKQETPLCRIFGCKKEDIFLGISVSEIYDEFGVPFANEDFETSCSRCYKVFGYKSIAVVRKSTKWSNAVIRVRAARER